MSMTCCRQGHAIIVNRRIDAHYFMPRKQIWLLAGCAIVALLLGMLAARTFTRSATPTATLDAGTLLAPARPLADFRLSTQEHAPFTRADLANHWTLLFFGFTSCPDVCPTTLAFMSQLEKSFADLPIEQRPRVVFVSVDSERDTPAKVGEYVRFFDPTFIGATGTKQEIDTVTKIFTVPYAITRTADGGYTVDHSAALFLVNPKAELQALFTPPHDLKTISADLRRVIAGWGNS
jgi:protein SCO1/2